MTHRLKRWKPETMILVLLITLGAWIRLVGIFNHSFAFTYDVGRDLLAARQIAVDHRPTLIGPTSGYEGIFYGPWWYYFLALLYLFTGGNPQLVALSIGILGSFCILLAFFFGKKFFKNSSMPLAMAAITAFSPALVSTSNQIWSPYVIPFLTALSLLILARGPGGKTRPFFLGLILGLIIEFEIIFGALFLFGTILSLVFWHRRRLDLFAWLKLGAGFSLITLPRVLFEFRHQFLMTKNLMRFLSDYFGPPQAGSFAGRLANRWLVFGNLWRDTVAGRQDVYGLILLSLTVFGMIFFWRQASERLKLMLKSCLTIVAVFVFGLLVYGGDLWDYYLVGLPIIFVFLLTASLTMIARGGRQVWRFLALSVLVGVVCLNLQPFDLGKRLNPPDFEGDAAVYRNQLAVVDYVYREAEGRRFNYTVYTPPVHDYTYRYLFTWYGPKFYGYAPADEAVSKLFVILEPDFQLPTRLIDWLKIREGDGKVVAEKTLRGGINVQTRER